MAARLMAVWTIGAVSMVAAPSFAPVDLSSGSAPPEVLTRHQSVQAAVPPAAPYRVNVLAGTDIDLASLDEDTLAGGVESKTQLPTPRPLSSDRLQEPVVAVSRLQTSTEIQRSVPNGARARPDIDPDGAFGMVSLAFADPGRVTGWRQVRRAYAQDRDDLRRCVSGACDADARLRHFAAALAPLAKASREDRIRAVNRVVNTRPYRSDAAFGGDRWARPAAMLDRGGDCEDFALLKMAALAALGVAESDMAIAVGHTSDGQPHAVLTVRSGSATLVLDNRSDWIQDDGDADFAPRYSVSPQQRWTHVAPYAADRKTISL